MKVWLSSLLVVGSLTMAPLSAQAFTDVNARYQEAVDYMVSEGYTNGINATQFGVDAPMKRLDAAVILAKVLGAESKAATVPFTDVPADRAWAVKALVDAGVTQGKTSTRFGSNDAMTRAEMTRLLRITFNIAESDRAIPFTDVSPRFVKDVSALYELKVATGKTSTRFGAEDTLKRGEFALFLHKLAQVDEDFEEGEDWTDAPEVESIT